jgi:uncharacterized membrane protein YoaT (DUF817 family)
MVDRVKENLIEFIYFGIKQAKASIFAGSFFVLLFLSNHISFIWIARYDFLFISAVLIQIVMYMTKLETKDEMKVIFLFHIVGLVLEIYKTNPAIGSWSYPEEGIFKIMNVPLYSGFMYAAVGSYIASAWKIFKLKLINMDHYILSVILCVLIYINFFTNHYFTDIRLILIPLTFILFYRTKVTFIAKEKIRTMYINISFILIAFFIWIAENISTYLGAWKYPDQVHEWSVVSTQKVTSWFLMVIISFIIVSSLKHFKERRENI